MGNPKAQFFHTTSAMVMFTLCVPGQEVNVLPGLLVPDGDRTPVASGHHELGVEVDAAGLFCVS